jgi:hypothetical protein
MQVFVKRADLTAATPPDPVPVIATYEDAPAIPYSTHDPSNSTPSAVTVLYLTADLIIHYSYLPPGMPANVTGIPSLGLISTWRDHADIIVNGEANRRIVDVFPEYKQRNSTSTYQQAQTAYGIDPSVWPPEAQAFKDEYDRGWSYVNAVRERTTSLIPSLPPDPTEDSYWPTRITPPIHFDPIF